MYSETNLQLFLAQGIGLGIAQGLLYLPSLAIVGHHFTRRRTLVMGIVASGASVGGIVHPIMLNLLFNGRIGFQNGVRISAGMNGALLIIANIFAFRASSNIQQNESSDSQPSKKWYQFFREPGYATAVIGYAHIFASTFFVITVLCRNFLFFLGGYYPLFYLQLSGITHGVDPTLAFYSVSGSVPYIISLHYNQSHRPDRHYERIQPTRAIDPQSTIRLPGSAQSNDRCRHNMRSSGHCLHLDAQCRCFGCGSNYLWVCFWSLCVHPLFVYRHFIYGSTDVSLLAPMLAGWADNVSEIGYAQSYFIP